MAKGTALGLSQDIETRWGSTYDLYLRLWKLKPVLEEYYSKKNALLPRLDSRGEIIDINGFSVNKASAKKEIINIRKKRFVRWEELAQVLSSLCQLLQDSELSVGQAFVHLTRCYGQYQSGMYDILIDPQDETQTEQYSAEEMNPIAKEVRHAPPLHSLILSIKIFHYSAFVKFRFTKFLESRL